MPDADMAVNSELWGFQAIVSDPTRRWRRQSALPGLARLEVASRLRGGAGWKRPAFFNVAWAFMLPGHWRGLIAVARRAALRETSGLF
jgi:hypothetical protein